MRNSTSTVRYKIGDSAWEGGGVRSKDGVRECRVCEFVLGAGTSEWRRTSLEKLTRPRATGAPAQSICTASITPKGPSTPTMPAPYTFFFARIASAHPASTCRRPRGGTARM